MRSSRSGSAPRPVPWIGCSSLRASGTAHRSSRSKPPGTAPRSSLTTFSEANRSFVLKSCFISCISSCTCAAHIPQTVIWQQLQRRMLCLETSPEDSQVHSTEQHSAREASPRHCAKLNRSQALPGFVAASVAAAARAGTEDADSGGRRPSLPFFLASAYGKMHKADRMHAETTGIDIAFPARSLNCTSDSPPRSNWSAGMPERRSFSKPEISRPRRK